MHSVGHGVGANTNPAQSRIEVAGFGMMRAGMNPRRHGRRSFRIQSGEGIDGVPAGVMGRVDRPFRRVRYCAYFAQRRYKIRRSLIRLGSPLKIDGIRRCL